MIFSYRILTAILYPLLLVFLFYRKIIKKEDPKRFKEKIFISKFNVKRDKKSKLIWFHAASIGEFKSILPIIKLLNLKDNNLKFLVTTSTYSSGNLAEIELKKLTSVEHRYLPLDIGYLMENFLISWRPDRIFIVDSEIWPNLILKAKKLKIPLALINGRLTPKSYNRWKRFPNTAKKIFGVFQLFICSNLDTKKYLDGFKLQNVYFKGNIKLIDLIKNENMDGSSSNEKFLFKKRFWLAASTHKGEDISLLKTHIELKKKFSDIITVIAPRHIKRSLEIETLSKKFNLESQILNKGQDVLSNKEIIIVNYFGALNNFFDIVKSVFICKSLISKFKNGGGQNPLEAVKYNCKLYHGPYVSNFKDIYKILNENGISKQIESYADLSENLLEDLQKTDKKNNDIPSSLKDLGQKTLNDTLKIIDNFIYNESK